MWQGAKLSGLYLKSTYSIPGQTDESHDGFADVLQVLGGTTKSTHSLIMKQITGLGAPSWQMPMHVHAGGGRAIRNYMYTSDGGPDQRCFKQVLLHETENDPMTFVIVAPCFMHITQLFYRSGLEIIDKFLEPVVRWRYFACVVKLSHVWRDLCIRIKIKFEELFGSELAADHARAFPPKCIAGRWGTTYLSEKTIRKACAHEPGGERRMLPTVLKEVFAKKIEEKSIHKPKAKAKQKGKAVAKAKGKHAGDDLDVHKAITDGDGEQQSSASTSALVDPGSEQAHEYRERIGRWRKDVMDAISDDRFFFVLDTAFAAHGILEHFMNFMSSTISNAELQCKGGHISQLACGMADDFMTELSAKIFKDITWATTAMEKLPIIIAWDLIGLAVTLNMHHAAAFHRRVVELVNKFKPHCATHRTRPNMNRYPNRHTTVLNDKTLLSIETVDLD